ncbi:alkaline phosphatase-like protein [Myriangium duriaei CBS 260.36]|uniref:Alkaline phosphatase-like protein n=1 Tax=Myriangium duriaei CBS 260.36 TaxID=1168546 RepID=A0A9P4JCI9_9PEZI|nr:alkaline phosphatase-like protein [Myriangium duriaei CBS 260.36]
MARLHIGQLCSRSFFYALLVLSTWSSKLVYLWPHLTSSLPPLLIVLYIPTFLLLDFVVVIVGRLLLHRPSNHRRLSAVSATLGGIISVITWFTASSAIAFNIETSGEISWAAAGNFANDWDGIKLLLSGSLGVGLCALAIAIISIAIRDRLYDGVGALLSLAWHTLLGSQPTRGEYRMLKDDVEEASVSMFSSDGEEEVKEYEPQDMSISENVDPIVAPRRCPLWLGRILVLAPFVTVAVLQAVRPTGQPYPHMSETLPFTLLKIFGPPMNDFCLPGGIDSMKLFPLPDIIPSSHWTPASGLNPAWHPIADWSSAAANHSLTIERPSWLPGNDTIPGFERWTSSNNSQQGFYRPELDPLRLSNLEESILTPIKDSLKDSKHKIKHIVLLTLETTRADVFPLTTSSHLYDFIRDSHRLSPQSDSSALDTLLSSLSPVAELLTGTTNTTGLSQFRNASTNKPGSWRARLASKPSTLNVVGATTGSSMTFKSMLGSHCGVHPMPVEFTEESTLKSYQPCIPHIFNLLSQNKTASSASSSNSFLDAPWTPVFTQSITDQYDRQDRLNTMMGFTHNNIFVKANLTEPTSKYWPPTEKESNYFGFPEPQIQPYLRDLFKGIQDKGERLFLSHITSQTHHPFRTPEGTGPDKEFLSKHGWGKESVLNEYLNTIHYGDNWLGEVMDMLDEAGMSNETLVVLVGDHGWTFAEDNDKHTSFENPHVTSFRVPLAFQHPSLPPLQLHLNATSLQIIPTILDLLTSSESLSETDMNIAKNLLPQYQGQSLLRPLKTKEHDRELWSPAIVNTGGALMTIGSAASPYRLAIPVCKPSEYRFTDISRDPNEKHQITAWSIDGLLNRINGSSEYTDEERQIRIEWARRAEKIARWWSWESKRLWRFDGGALQVGRKGGETDGAGTVKKKHWWET